MDGNFYSKVKKVLNGTVRILMRACIFLLAALFIVSLLTGQWYAFLGGVLLMLVCFAFSKGIDQKDILWFIYDKIK